MPEMRPVASPTKAFSNASVRALVMSVTQGERMVRDLGCPGLYLRIRADREPTWHHVHTVDGKAMRPSLGTYPDTTLAQARQRVEERRRQLQEGRALKSPAQVRRETNEAVKEAKQAESNRVTIAKLFEDWHRRDIKPD